MYSLKKKPALYLPSSHPLWTINRFQPNILSFFVSYVLQSALADLEPEGGGDLPPPRLPSQSLSPLIQLSYYLENAVNSPNVLEQYWLPEQLWGPHLLRTVYWPCCEIIWRLGLARSGCHIARGMKLTGCLDSPVLHWCFFFVWIWLLGSSVSVSRLLIAISAGVPCSLQVICHSSINSYIYSLLMDSLCTTNSVSILLFVCTHRASLYLVSPLLKWQCIMFGCRGISLATGGMGKMSRFICKKILWNNYENETDVIQYYRIAQH